MRFFIKIILCTLFNITSIYVSAQPSNDAFANAIEVSLGEAEHVYPLSGYYTIANATDDRPLNTSAPCIDYNATQNVWFKIQAKTTLLEITLIPKGISESIRYSSLTLWESNGTTAIVCNSAAWFDEVFIPSTVTIGQWYYIEVKGYEYAGGGGFTLSLSDGSLTYDAYEGAYDISNILNLCSRDKEFSTISKTGDKNAGSCSSFSVPNANVWFKFQATSTMLEVSVESGGLKGTILYAVATIWESDGNTEIACETPNASTGPTITRTGNLIIGNWYYISVDAAYPGSFTLCLSDYISNDYHAGAIDLTPIGINNCTPLSGYSLSGATFDRSKGSCITGSSIRANVWFKILAPASGVIDCTLHTGGGSGTLTFPNISLWESNGVTEIDCSTGNSYTTPQVKTTNATPGNWYYISVDKGSNASNGGTFTLCFSDGLDYDFYSGAKDISNLLNNCSLDAQYTTTNKTGDKIVGNCWAMSTPKHNVWFKVQASNNGVINATLTTGGSKGTIRYAKMAMWESDGITQIICGSSPSSPYGSVSILSTNLISNNWYYISVDVPLGAYQGSFTLCLTEVLDYDYFAGAIDVSHLINNCSANNEYTNNNKTADKGPSTCSPVNGNVWFKIQAPLSGVIRAKISTVGTLGTLRDGVVTLWDGNGLVEISCATALGWNEITVQSPLVVPGGWYYLSVDSKSTTTLGSFTLCLSDALDYDYYEGAIDITNLLNSCSLDKGYSNVGRTADKNVGNCTGGYGQGVNSNVWFKIQAPISGIINVSLFTGGIKGSMQYANMTLWESDGLTQVDCNKVGGYASAFVKTAFATPGNMYYVSVDVGRSNTTGTFTLCLSDVPDYDFYEGAIDVTNLIGNCSTNGQYSTLGATPDKNPASCWDASPDVNRWFKFLANTSNMDVSVKTGGVLGTGSNMNIAVWEADGITEVNCNRYLGPPNYVQGIVSVNLSNIIPNNWYYISVDSYTSFNPSSIYEGSFTLCLTNKDIWTGAINSDWGTGGNWKSGIVPSSLAKVIIPQTTNNPILDINRTIDELTINAGASFNINNLQLSISSNFTNLGNLITPGEVIFNGSTAQTISGATTFDKLTINNFWGVAISSGIQQVTGILTVSSGTFSTNHLLTIVSNALGTGSIASVAVGGRITGNVTAQRYFNMPTDGWVSLASPVYGKTITSWNDDIVTTGFNGANYPAAIYNWVNIYSYNESTLGNFNQGYITATDISNTLPLGSGFLNYILAGNKTVDVTGVIHTGNFNFSISYTDDILYPPFDDGWNLLGNPYISTIDWDAAGWTKSNVNNAIYIWDDNVQQFASYVNGIGTNGGSRYIPSSQSFWVQTNAASPSLIVTEACKASVDAAFHARTSFDLLKIQLSNTSSLLKDESILLFDNTATPNFDPTLDARKLKSQNTSSPSVSMLTNSNENLSINTLKRKNLGNEIPLLVTVGTTGSYTLSFPVNSLNEPLIFLKDLSTGAVTDLNISPTYTFTITNTITEPRFKLFIGKTPPNTALPIELLSFTAQINKNNVDLKWITATETNNDYFEVQKSKDGKKWVKVLQMEGAGNSSQLIEYFDIDYSPFKGKSFYRLKQVDFDGRYSYSTIAPVSFTDQQNTEIVVYPNPSNGADINLIIPENYGNEILVVLRDVTGKDIYTKLLKTNYKTYTLNIRNQEKIPKGMYLITASSEQKITSFRLIVR